jgi:hypothetical protein
MLVNQSGLRRVLIVSLEPLAPTPLIKRFQPAQDGLLPT